MTSPTDCANQEKMKHVTELATRNNKDSMKDDARQPTQPSGTEPKRAEQIPTLGASESEEATAVTDLPKNSRHQNEPQELSSTTQPLNRPVKEETTPVYLPSKFEGLVQRAIIQLQTAALEIFQSTNRQEP